MVMSERWKATYKIFLNDNVNIEEIQRDLDIVINYCKYSRIITAVSFYCDDDVLNQFKYNNYDENGSPIKVQYPRCYELSLSRFHDEELIAHFDKKVRFYTDDEFVTYDEYNEEEFMKLFNSTIEKYSQSVSFRFSRGQKEIVDLIMQHPSIKDNVKMHHWCEHKCIE